MRVLALLHYILSEIGGSVCALLCLLVAPLYLRYLVTPTAVHQEYLRTLLAVRISVSYYSNSKPSSLMLQPRTCAIIKRRRRAPSCGTGGN